MALAFGLKQFPPDVQKRVIGKDIIDGGSFSGDSAMVFTEFNPRKVYAFEPNPDTIPVLKQVLQDNSTVLGNRKNQIEVVPLALGGSKGTLTLFSLGELHTGATILQTRQESYKNKSHASSYEVDVISIDEYAQEHSLEVGLIKLDIEGAEYDTILGAKETIMKQKPLLIISLYHTLKDFFEIKPLIESWNLGYQFAIRHDHPAHVFDAEYTLMAY
jgi:FkbM family methyltransferase